MNGWPSGDLGLRVSVVMKPLEEPQQLFVDHGVTHDRIVERVEFRLGRQGTVDEQVGNFEEGGFLRELLDRHAAVQENTGIAVDVSDLTLGTGGSHETRIEREDAQILGQIRDVEYIGPDGSR